VLLTEAGLAQYESESPPSFAANVFLATGRPTRAMEILASRSNTTHIRDPEAGGRISYGGADRALDRIRVLGASGVVGQPLRAELEEMRRIWAGPQYSPRERLLLRRHAALGMLVPLSLDREALAMWNEGLDIDEPVWQALLSSWTDSATARDRLLEARHRNVPVHRTADRDFALGVVASRVGDHRLALELFSRLDSLPLSLDGVDTRWGLRTQSYLWRAEAYEALGDLELTREQYERLMRLLHDADSLGTRSVARARVGRQRIM
jgi:hypothetical protein